MKKYTLNNYVQVETKGEYEAFDKPFVVFYGKHGIIISDNEFIHEKKDLITDSIRIYVAKPCETGSIPLFASGYFSVQLQELFERIIPDEIEPKDFFRNPEYNSRLHNNYLGLIKSLQEIGYIETEEFINALKRGN